MQRHFIGRKVNTVILFELSNKIIYNLLVEVVAAKTVVTACCKNLEYAVADFKYRYIKCTAAEVIYHNLLVVVLVKTVSKSCGCRLVNNSQNVKTRDFARVLCRLPLCVTEVCRDGDNRLCNRLAEVAFSVRLQLLKNHSRYFLRSVELAVNVRFVIGTHLTLN